MYLNARTSFFVDIEPAEKPQDKRFSSEMSSRWFCDINEETTITPIPKTRGRSSLSIKTGGLSFSKKRFSELSERDSDDESMRESSVNTSRTPFTWKKEKNIGNEQPKTHR